MKGGRGEVGLLSGSFACVSSCGGADRSGPAVDGVSYLPEIERRKVERSCSACAELDLSHIPLERLRR